MPARAIGAARGKAIDSGFVALSGSGLRQWDERYARERLRLRTFLRDSVLYFPRFLGSSE